MMKLWCYIPIVCLLLVFTAVVHGAEVTNLKSRQEGSLVVVEYDLVGELGEGEAEVVVILETGGRQYRAERLSLAGDRGKPVKVGRGKRFVWNIAADFPAGFEGELIWNVTARSLSASTSPSRKQPGSAVGVTSPSAVRSTNNVNTISFFVDDVISLLPPDMASMIKPQIGLLLREAQETPKGQSWTRAVIEPAGFARELAAPLPLNDPLPWVERLGGSLRHILDVAFSNPRDPLNEKLKLNIQQFIEQTPGKEHQISYSGYIGRQTDEILRELYSLKGHTNAVTYPVLVCLTADLWASVWKAQGGASPFAVASSFTRKPLDLALKGGIPFNPRENPCSHLDPKSPYYRDCMASYYERMKQESRQKQLDNYLQMQELKQKYPVRKP